MKCYIKVYTRYIPFPGIYIWHIPGQLKSCALPGSRIAVEMQQHTGVDLQVNVLQNVLQKISYDAVIYNCSVKRAFQGLVWCPPPGHFLSVNTGPKLWWWFYRLFLCSYSESLKTNIRIKLV